MAGNPFLSELRQRDPAAESTSALDTASAGEVFRGALFSRFVNNLLALPSASGDLLALGAAGLEHINPSAPAREALHAARGTESPTFRERFERQREQFPASALRAIPRPTVEDVVAGVRSVPSLLPGGETPGEAFARHRGAIAQDQETRRAEHPIAAEVGRVGGDILTLIGGRAPVAGIIRRAEQRLAPRHPDMAFGSAAAPQVVEPGLRRTVDRALNSPRARRLARGAGRSTETGLEAAVLQVLSDAESDPIQAAALAAGGQAAGSLFLETGRGLLSGGLTRSSAKIAITAASMGALWQLGKAATPGGRDRVLESIESGFDKVAYSLMLGGLAAAAGAPRYRDTKLAEEIPMLVDAFAAIPRGATLQIVKKLAESDDATQSRVERALDGIARGEFGGEHQRTLVRAMNDGRLVETVNRLAEQDNAFRQQLDALRLVESDRDSDAGAGGSQ